MPSGVKRVGRLLVRLRDVVDDRLAVDRERHRAALVDVGDVVLDVEAVVRRCRGPDTAGTRACPSAAAISAGGSCSSSTSTSPASNDCTAVVASTMILPSTRSSLTVSASRQFGSFTSVIEALGCADSTLNGPFVTMFSGRVHLSPNCSTVFCGTGRNTECADCCTNHGCGDVSVTSSVLSSVALTPTLSFSASQFDLHELYSTAPLMPKSW